MKKSNKIESANSTNCDETAPAKPLVTLRPWPHGPNVPRATIRMTVTPVVAREWLLANARNRPVSQARLALIIADMRGGHFVYNGDAIRFSWSPETGWLIASGQHRLIACCETGVSFDAPVAIIDHDARKHVDTGRTCNAPQAWMRETGTTLSNWNIARVNAAWQGLNNWTPLRTPEAWGEAHEMFRNGIDAMEAIFRSHKAVTNNAPYVAAFVVAYYENPRAVEEMARLFEDGAGFESGTPVHVLTKYAHGIGKKDKDAARFSRALNLIAAHIDGKTRNIPRTDASVVARFRKAVGLPPLTA